jgi:S-adenosylmethionine/arginine decarboxylase-like enzyme
VSVPLVSPAPEYVHLIADLLGVAETQLRDASLVGGLIIAAAGAVGLAPLGMPLVRSLPQGGVSGILLMYGCHLAIHTMPERGLLLLDVLVPRPLDPTHALTVFARRLSPARILSEQRPRG